MPQPERLSSAQLGQEGGEQFSTSQQADRVVEEREPVCSPMMFRGVDFSRLTGPEAEALLNDSSEASMSRTNPVQGSEGEVANGSQTSEGSGWGLGGLGGRIVGAFDSAKGTVGTVVSDWDEFKKGIVDDPSGHLLPSESREGHRKRQLGEAQERIRKGQSGGSGLSYVTSNELTRANNAAEEARRIMGEGGSQSAVVFSGPQEPAGESSNSNN